MFLKQSRQTNGRILLSLVAGYREDGVVRHRYVEHFGYLDNLLLIYPDPVAHFKDVARQRTLEARNEPIYINTNVSLSTGSLRKNLGYVFIQQLYFQLAINDFLNLKQRKERVKYRFDEVLRLLVYSRILKPTSILSTYDNRAVYFERFDFSLHDIYRSLDKLICFKDDLLTYLYTKINQHFKIDTSLAYYDCTNYYFEIEYNDEDEVDENGVVIKTGLRKKGVSKEHRPNPIVTMGLLLDSTGIPISYDLFPGNESEKTTLRPLLNNAKGKYNLGKVVVVADRGLNTSDNIFFNNNELNGYIYSKSLRVADNEFKTWAFVDDLTTGNNIKSRIHTFDVTLLRNNARNVRTTVIQKQVVYYSKKYAQRSAYLRSVAIEKAKSLIEDPGKYNKATSYGAANYIRNIDYDKLTGEVIAKDLSLDIDKITQEEKYDGYYAIVTSETHLSDEQIIERYKGLWKIEESFRIIKSELKARPVFLSLDNHIRAHFFICYIAFLLIRLLERKVDEKYSCNELIKTMNAYGCTHIQDNLYAFDFRDEVIEDLEKIFKIDLSKQYLELNKIKKLLNKTKT